MSYPTSRLSRTTCRRGVGSGFTLVELMVAIAVAAILIGVALPSFDTVFNDGRINGQANEFVATLQLARMEAIRRNSHVVVCPSTNQTTCAAAGAVWTGWLAYADSNNNGAQDAGETTLRVGVVNPLVKVDSSPNISGSAGGAITFRGDGLARDAAGNLLDGILRVCVLSKHPPENIRDVEIGAGSRISVSSQNGGGACAVPPDTH